MQIACAVVSQPCCPTSPFEKVQEQELEKFMQSSKRLEHVVQNVHLKFFEIAPAGQEFFKESKTRMHALDMFAALLHCWLRDGSGLGCCGNWATCANHDPPIWQCFAHWCPMSQPSQRPWQVSHSRTHTGTHFVDPPWAKRNCGSTVLSGSQTCSWDLVKDSTILLRTAAHTHTYIICHHFYSTPKTDVETCWKVTCRELKKTIICTKHISRCPTFLSISRLAYVII